MLARNRQQIKAQNVIKEFLLRSGLSQTRYLVKKQGGLTVSETYTEKQKEHTDWVNKLFEFTLIHKINKTHLSRLGKLIFDTENKTASELMEVIALLFVQDKQLQNISLHSLLSFPQMYQMYKMNNIFLQHTCLLHGIQSHSYFLPLLLSIDNGQRQKLHEKVVKLDLAVSNRVKQELSDLRLDNSELFIIEKIKNQILKLKVRFKLLKEILFSIENQVYPLDTTQNLKFKE